MRNFIIIIFLTFLIFGIQFYRLSRSEGISINSNYVGVKKATSIEELLKKEIILPKIKIEQTLRTKIYEDSIFKNLFGISYMNQYDLFVKNNLVYELYTDGNNKRGSWKERMNCRGTEEKVSYGDTLYMGRVSSSEEIMNVLDKYDCLRLDLQDYYVEDEIKKLSPGNYHDGLNGDIQVLLLPKVEWLALLLVSFGETIGLISLLRYLHKLSSKGLFGEQAC